MGLDEERSFKRRVDKRDELLAHILDAAAATRTKKPVGQLKQHAIFAHELQNTLRMTVGLPNICCACKIFVISV